MCLSQLLLAALDSRQPLIYNSITLWSADPTCALHDSTYPQISAASPVTCFLWKITPCQAVGGAKEVVVLLIVSAAGDVHYGGRVEKTIQFYLY